MKTYNTMPVFHSLCRTPMTPTEQAITWLVLAVASFLFVLYFIAAISHNKNFEEFVKALSFVVFFIGLIIAALYTMFMGYNGLIYLIST